jgi:23S rRNA (uracil1939-C5)-methyltransferase
VELNKAAVKDAITNAKINGINNIRFFADDAGQFMLKTSAKMLEDKSAGIDVVFMDPPRAGSDENFMSSVVKLAPKKVVYVSCNPETLARDLKYFIKNGYKVESAVPVDMFPHTGHIETVVSMARKR